MIGSGLATGLGIVRGRLGRTGLATVALLAVAVIAAACETAPPRYESTPPSFAGLPPLVFDLDRIEVVELPAAPHPEDVDHLLPTPPAVAVGIWVTDRLRARGTVGTLRVTVEEASARLTALETETEFEDIFTKEQAERLDVKLHVTIEAIDHNGEVNGSATAEATRSRTLPEGITLAERDRVYDEVIAALLHDYNATQEKAIRQYLALYLL
ncbi:MAG: hypothetical protein OXO52_00150 [Rhodospirillales bacterium]|nr:hypothetical protein [Rhodospirillales bacterium]MDE0379857.1 hypothetical protein [Rhodospirillales bacterium]